MRYSAVAYRPQAARESRPGFQGAARPPANDNVAGRGFRHPPVAANDNRAGHPLRRSLPGFSQPAGGVPGWSKGLARGLARGLLRASPVAPAFVIGEQIYRGWIGLDDHPAAVGWANPVDLVADTFPWTTQRPDRAYTNCLNLAVHGGPIAGTNSCLTLQAPPFARGGEAVGSRYTVPAGQHHHWINVYGGQVLRWRTVFKIWNRFGGSLDYVMARQKPTWQPLVRPAVEPWIDPLSTPVGNPSPIPHAPPYRHIPKRRVNPRRSPTERSRWGPRVRSWRGPRLRPYQVPALRVGSVVTPNGVRPIPKQAVGHNRLPPGTRGTREKETKLRMGGVLGQIASRAVGGATEAMDWVTALWWALPSDARTKGYTDPWDKAQDLWNNLHRIDHFQAVINIALMQAQDRAIGRVSSRISWTFGTFGLDFGLTGFNQPNRE